MNAIPISKETLKDLYGPSFFLLEGELAQLSEVQEDIAEVEKPIAEIETKAPASETPRVAPVQEEKSVVSDAKPGIQWKGKPTSKI